ncbi:MAG: hypothetical protein QOJ34_269, partial [Pseudonocardiales bacterium]|nr:hypothetical protein [Pseudonocardiales bacterium]
REAEWVRRHLNVLLGFGEDVGSATGDRRSEAFAGWRRLFEALADARPLVAVFEDLHWADEGLLDFVDHLIDWAGSVPLLVVCSARPELFERRPGWGGGKSNAVTISLSPLSDNETARLIGSLMGRPVVEAELQQQLLSRAGGNPLFTEQFVQMQAEQAGLDTLSLPDSVQGIVSARLDALAAPEKQLLQDAAVIGKVFWPSAVAALAGTAERSPLEETLHHLERRQFVRRERQSSISGETQYAFQHILLRDVAYGQIPRSVRAGKHALAARWIQSLGRPDENAEMLAHHYMSALEFARAAGQDTGTLAADARDAIIEAAERASALNAHAAAVRFYREALALSPDAPGNYHADLLFGLAMATSRAGEDEPDEVLEAGVTALLAVDDRPRAAVLEAEISRLWWERGDGHRSAEHGARANDLVRDEPTSPDKAIVLSGLARLLMLAGSLEMGAAAAEDALAMSETLGLAEVHADVLVTLGTARAFANHPEGPSEIRRALGLALAGNFLATAIRAYSNLGTLAERDGDLRASVSAAQQAEAVAQRLGSWRALRWTRANRVGVLLATGEWEECAETADEAVSQSETLGPHYLDAEAYLVRALLRLARGRIDAAVEDQVAGMVSARRAKDPQILYSKLAWSACVLAEAGQLDDSREMLDELIRTVSADEIDLLAYAAPEVALVAETLGRREELLLWLGPGLGSVWTNTARAILDHEYDAALSTLEPMGAVYLASLIRLRAGENLVQQGRREEAEAVLQPAITFFESVAATRYLRSAQALLAA